MAKKSNKVKVGITLDKATFDKLENESIALGLTKSSFIAYKINTSK